MKQEIQEAEETALEETDHKVVVVVVEVQVLVVGEVLVSTQGLIALGVVAVEVLTDLVALQVRILL
jgi:hypothetical protein